MGHVTPERSYFLTIEVARLLMMIINSTAHTCMEFPPNVAGYDPNVPATNCTTSRLPRAAKIRGERISAFAVMAALLNVTSVTAPIQSAGMGSTPYGDAFGDGCHVSRLGAECDQRGCARPVQSAVGTTRALLVKEAGGLGLWSGDNTNARAGDTFQYKYYLNGNLWKRDRAVARSSTHPTITIIYDSNAFNCRVTLVCP